MAYPIDIYSVDVLFDLFCKASPVATTTNVMTPLGAYKNRAERVVFNFLNAGHLGGMMTHQILLKVIQFIARSKTELECVSPIKSPFENSDVNVLRIGFRHGR